MQSGYEVGIRDGVLRGDELKVYVQHTIATLVHSGNDVGDNGILYLHVVEHQRGQCTVKAAVFCQGGQVHHRSDTNLLGSSNERFIVQFYQRAVRADAVGERDQAGLIG